MSLHFPFQNSTGIALMAIGFVIRYWVGKRRFYRRMITGVEFFKSYGASVFIRIFESLAMLISIVIIVSGALLLIAGIW